MNSTVEIFNDQEQAADRIEELKRTGFHDADMFLLYKGEHIIDNIKGSLETLSDDTSVAQSSLWERFRGLLGAREEFKSVLGKMGLEEDSSKHYTEAVESGKILLIIFSDKLGETVDQ